MTPNRSRLRRRTTATTALAALTAVLLPRQGTPGPATASPVTATPRSAAGAAAPSVKAAFQRLLSDLAAAPAAAIRPPGYRAYLERLAKSAAHSSASGQSCAAEKALAEVRSALTHYRHVVKGPIRVGPTEAAVIGADVLDIQVLLLSRKGTASCGGAKSPGSAVAGPVTDVISQDPAQVTFRVLFPAPDFTEQTGGGAPYLAMSSRGMGDISSLFEPDTAAVKAADQVNPGGAMVGLPQVPGTGELLAVPQGGSVTVRVLAASSYQLPGVRLWPAQESPPAGNAIGDDGSPAPSAPFPFVISKAAYRSKAPFPARPAVAGDRDSMHGLGTAGVFTAAASYRAAGGALTVYSSVTVQVSFGGTKKNTFGPASLISPWDTGFQETWGSTLLNYPSVAGALGPASPVTKLCGEQMIIITAPVLQGAAAQYAADRSADGILTRYFLTGPTSSGGAGTTATQIRDFIAGQYDSGCPIKPSYVLLLGDTSLVPTFEISLGIHAANGSFTGNFLGEDPVATDMPYGFIHQAAQVDKSVNGVFTNYITDYDQDLFVGRIPVPGAGGEPNSAALGEVDTLHGYEDTPPAITSGFYRDVTGSEFFQPCPAIQTDCGRSSSPKKPVTPSTKDLQPFLRSSEAVGTQAQFAGKTFQRVASDESNYDPGVTVTPQKFDDGTPIPAGISWTGTAANVSQYVNAGTFLLWHSDHGNGNGTGWYEPPFSMTNVQAASPPGFALPVVWSSDCDSGKFDDPTAAAFPFTIPGNVPSFGELWIESEHAAGFVGASRQSPIYQDGFMLRGMGTSLFPEEGNIWRTALGLAPVPAVRQLGPLLDAAKAYIVAQTSANLTTSIGAQGTVLEYNDLGDPSMPIWRDPPASLIVKAISASLAGSPGAGKHSVVVNVKQPRTDGMTVILTATGVAEPIGAGTLQGGTTTIEVPISLLDLNGVTATFVKDGFLAATVPLGKTATSTGKE